MKPANEEDPTVSSDTDYDSIPRTLSKGCCMYIGLYDRLIKAKLLDDGSSDGRP